MIKIISKHNIFMDIPENIYQKNEDRIVDSISHEVTINFEDSGSVFIDSNFYDWEIFTKSKELSLILKEKNEVTFESEQKIFHMFLNLSDEYEYDVYDMTDFTDGTELDSIDGGIAAGNYNDAVEFIVDEIEGV